MADKKIYVGRSVNSFNSSKAFAPISRVTFKKKEDSIVTAGDDTGFELVADCPWATQEMANAVLAEVGGYIYQPYEATRAVVPLDVELGLGVTINGVYSVIASLTESFNAMFSADVSAPDLGELEDEYPIEAAKDRQVNRRISEAEAAIKVNADNIALSVKDASGNGTTFTVSANGAYFVDAQGNTVAINGGTIQAGTITANQIQAGTITLSNLDATTQAAINAGLTEGEVRTVITDELVSAPTIAGGEFCDLQQQAFLKMIPYSQTDGYKLVFCTPLHDETDPLLTIVANDAGSGALGVYTDFQVGGDTFIRAYPDYNGYGARCRLTGDWTEVMGDISFYGGIKLDSESYGSSLPSSGSEGQLFFVVN